MIDMLKRHEIQVLRRAEHTWSEIAALSGVSEKTARRIAAEVPVTTVDNAAERARRQVGRPSKAEAYREILVQALTEDPALRSVELLYRARQAGYTGGKSAVYALAQTLRLRAAIDAASGRPNKVAVRLSPIGRLDRVSQRLAIPLTDHRAGDRGQSMVDGAVAEGAQFVGDQTRDGVKVWRRASIDPPSTKLVGHRGSLPY
jgi:transposase